MNDKVSTANLGAVASVRGSVMAMPFDGQLPPTYSVLDAGAETKIVIEVPVLHDAWHMRGIARRPAQGLAGGMVVTDTSGPLKMPVGIRRAIADGSTDITVVLRHNSAFRRGSVPRCMGKLAYPEFPMMARIWTARQNINYNNALHPMKQPPAGMRIQLFRPLRPLRVDRFSIGPERIAAALRLDHDDALHQMESVEAKRL